MNCATSFDGSGLVLSGLQCKTAVARGDGSGSDCFCLWSFDQAQFEKGFQFFRMIFCGIIVIQAFFDLQLESILTVLCPEFLQVFVRETSHGKLETDPVDFCGSICGWGQECFTCCIAVTGDHAHIRMSIFVCFLEFLFSFSVHFFTAAPFTGHLIFRCC